MFNFAAVSNVSEICFSNILHFEAELMVVITTLLAYQSTLIYTSAIVHYIFNVLRPPKPLQCPHQDVGNPGRLQAGNTSSSSSSSSSSAVDQPSLDPQSTCCQDLTALCDCKEAEQTVHHILQDCPIWRKQRLQLWPQDESTTNKLWGSVKDLRRTTGNTNLIIIMMMIMIIIIIYIAQFDTNGILTALYIVIQYIQMQCVHT